MINNKQVLKTLYYIDRPEPWENIKPQKHKNVLDITYNDGRIERDGVEILPSQISGKALIDKWEQNNEL